MANPALNSTRTWERACALTWARGCVQENPCWPDCFECARDCIVENNLDEWDRDQASTSVYWRYTHGVS